MSAAQKNLAYLRRRMTLKAAKAWREATASKRVLPDFIIIGAQKAGTTSLFRYLRRHPEVVPAFKKEVKFFDCNFDRGLNWYRSHFPYASEMGSKHKITGEASPHYIFHPLSPQRIAETQPDVKLIALLRNPVDRAYSHYQLNVRRGRESLSFAEAIEKEPERLAGEVERILANSSHPLFTFLHYSYLSRGLYADQLSRWLDYFSVEQILVIQSETFQSDPAGIYRQVLEFLGLPEWELQQYKKHNTGSYDELDPAIRSRLNAYFDPHNQRLYDLLGRDFGW